MVSGKLVAIQQSRSRPQSNERQLKAIELTLMTELLEPSKQQKVLEIGTGSGYQAAVLAALAGRIFTIEIVPELAQSAAALLKSLGVRNSSDCLYCSLWRCINITE